MAGRSLNIDIKTQDAQTLAALKRLEREFKGLDNQIDRTSKRGVTMGNAFAGLAIGAGVKYAVGEYEQAEQQLRSTEAVIKSTGNAAEVSAGQQEELVAQLSKVAGVDDEIVNGGANMLRTFTSIKDEQFGEALAASMDLAAFKGIELAAASEQVGKALNNPLTGLTKLTKQGVVFSDQQKQMVKDFMAVGDIAGAQGVILDELATEYGGQAEAMATESGRMKVAMDDAAESAGKALAPAVTVAAEAVGGLAGAFSALPVPVQQAAFATAAGTAAWVKLAPAVRSASESVGGFTQSIGGSAGVMNLATVAALPLGVALVGMGLKAQEAAKNAAIMDAAIADLTSTADALGVTVDEVFKTDFLIDAVKIDPKLADDLEAAGGDLSGFAAAAAGTDEEWNRYKENLSGSDFDNNALKLQLESMREQLLGGRDAAGAAADATEELGSVTEEAATSVGGFAGVSESLSRSLGTVTSEVNDQAESLRDLNDEMNEAVDLAYKLAGAELSLSGAHDSVQDAQEALAEARASGDAEDRQRAEDRLTRAMLDEAAAVGDLYEQQAIANGESVDAAKKAELQRQAMARLTGETGFTNAVLDEFTASLDAAAQVRTVKIDVTEAVANLGLLIRELQLTTAAMGQVTGLVGQQVATGVTGAIDVGVNGRGTRGLRGAAAPVTVNISAPGMIVGGTKSDLLKQATKAGRKTAQQIKVGS